MSPDTDTPRGRLRLLLDDELLTGDDVPSTRDRILPLIPIGDASYWMRDGVDKAVRDWMRNHGLVLIKDPSADADAAMIAEWEQLELDDVLNHIRHVNKQTADDQAALQRRLERWCAAHEGLDLTPSDLRRMAS